MGEFVNSRSLTALAYATAGVIALLNIWLLALTFRSSFR
jgi:Mn2+/Fe2+ NRAMP family transporter